MNLHMRTELRSDFENEIHSALLQAFPRAHGALRPPSPHTDVVDESNLVSTEKLRGEDGCL